MSDQELNQESSQEQESKKKVDNKNSILAKTSDNISYLEDKFVDGKWCPEKFHPSNKTCPNIHRSVRETVEILLEHEVPLSVLWREKGYFRVAIDKFRKRGRPKLTDTVGLSVLWFVKEKFENSRETWRIEEDTTNYQVFEKIVGKKDKTGVINPGGRILVPNIQQVTRDTLSSRAKDSSLPSSSLSNQSDVARDSQGNQVVNNGEAAHVSQQNGEREGEAQGEGDSQGDKGNQGDQHGNGVDCRENDREVDFADELGHNGSLDISPRPSTHNTLLTQGAMLSSSDIDVCMKLHQALEGWHVFEPGFPFDGRDNTISKRVPSNLVFIMHEEHHWYVIHLDSVSRYINIYDSMPDNDRDESVLRCIKNWGIKNGSKIDRWTQDPSRYEGLKVNRMECAEQDDGYNCGMFAVAFASALIEGRPVPQELDADAMRKDYASRLQGYEFDMESDQEVASPTTELAEHKHVKGNSTTGFPQEHRKTPPWLRERLRERLRKRLRRTSSDSLSTIGPRKSKRNRLESLGDDDESRPSQKVEEIDKLALELGANDEALAEANKLLAERQKKRDSLEKVVASKNEQILLEPVEAELVTWAVGANIITDPTSQASILDKQLRASRVEQLRQDLGIYTDMLESVERAEHELLDQVEKLEQERQVLEEERHELAQALMMQLKR